MSCSFLFLFIDSAEKKEENASGKNQLSPLLFGLMKIGLLNFYKKVRNKRKIPKAKRLKEEAKKRGHSVKVIYPYEATLTFNKGISILYNNKPITSKTFDVIIPIVGISENIHIRAAIINQFEHLKIPILNKYDAVVTAKSKLHSLQVLAAHNLPVVKTVFLQDIEEMGKSLKELKFPIIVKTLFGSLGKGVAVLESYRSALSTIQLITKSESISKYILLQEYIKESKGKDIRIFVVGNNVVACMQRTAKKGDFRSNLHAGGGAKPYTPSTKMKKIAIKATKTLGLDFAGVDLLTTKDGPKIMEVNVNPGISIEEVTGENVCEPIIELAEKKVEKIKKRKTQNKSV